MNDSVEQTIPSKSRKAIGLAISLWIAGLAVLITLSVMIRMHPTFWPIERGVMDFIQGPHPIPCVFSPQNRSWLDVASDEINTFNDPIPSIIIPGALGILFLLFRQWLATLAMWLSVATASAIWGGIGLLVARPRATPADGICMHRLIKAYSFPSGHVMHDVVLWGFVFYLTTTHSARHSRFHWLLLPLQILIIIYVLIVGYARLEAGEHHFLDVIGGYLAGLLWLGLGILFYRLLLHFRQRFHKNHQHSRATQHSTRA